MMEKIGQRERQIWIAAVAVLGTSLVWLAVVNGLLLIERLTIVPRIILVVKTLAHVAPPLIRALAPLAIVGGLMAVFIGWLAANVRANGHEQGVGARNA